MPRKQLKRFKHSGRRLYSISQRFDEFGIANDSFDQDVRPVGVRRGTFTLLECVNNKKKFN